MVLLEAYFNAPHKINFSVRLTPSLEDSYAITQEIIGFRRLQASTHLALSKKLILDISNTKKLPTTTRADDANFHDGVAHPRASLCLRCFGMELCYLLALFRMIQNMKMNLRTDFGVSTSF